MGNTILSQLLSAAVKKGASDIHISEDDIVIFRISGDLCPLSSSGTLGKEQIQGVLKGLLKDDELAYEKFVEERDMDFSFLHTDGTSFRVNSFFKLGKISLVLRRIEGEAKSMSELGLPVGVEKFTKLKQGLVVVTGPTGSGKSTSMVSILDAINKERSEHIITIEDPIEFIFKNDKSIFSQREVGRDTKSFASAMRSALREDPDIIVVGELRDKVTISLALELAETGHLVFATLHTSGSVSTISRLVSFFPSEIQDSILYRLGDALYGILSQRLIKKANDVGRVGIFEVLIGTPGVRNLIKSGDLNQIDAQLEMGSKEGMIQMERYAKELEDKGLINKEDYIHYFKDEI